MPKPDIDSNSKTTQAGNNEKENSSISFSEILKAAIVSDEEFEAMRAERVERAKVNPNAFENWYPTVVDLGLEAPRSFVFPFPYDIQVALINNEITDDLKAKMRVIANRVIAAGSTLGFPLFIKNSLFSAKFNWQNSCFVTAEDSVEDVENKIANIFLEWAMVGDSIALNLVVREFIPTKPLFTAFHGRLPITREFRIFSKDGYSYEYQFYWPSDAIRDPSAEDWESKLKEAEKITVNELECICDVSDRLTTALGGDWSVDFLQDENGIWHLIDIAVAGMSYKSENVTKIFF